MKKYIKTFLKAGREAKEKYYDYLRTELPEILYRKESMRFLDF